MQEGEDLLYRPVLAGVLDAAAIDDPQWTLGQIMLLNEALDVKAENEYRFNKALDAKAKNK